MECWQTTQNPKPKRIRVKSILIGIIITVITFLIFELKPEGYFTEAQLQTLNLKDESVLVIKPLLTANAYKLGGFYDYYHGKCDTKCLTVEIDENIQYKYTSSLRAWVRLENLGAGMTTDYELSKDPSKLYSYDKIIMLHSEYVPRNLFDALQKHPFVVYLYPNALYAEVDVNYENNTMTLLRGHGYPTPEIHNGFDWRYDNSRPYEFETSCTDWQFHDIPNGKMLNCYPENFVLNNTSIFEYLKNL